MGGMGINSIEALRRSYGSADSEKPIKPVRSTALRRPTIMLSPTLFGSAIFAETGGSTNAAAYLYSSFATRSRFASTRRTIYHLPMQLNVSDSMAAADIIEIACIPESAPLSQTTMFCTKAAVTASIGAKSVSGRPLNRLATDENTPILLIIPMPSKTALVMKNALRSNGMTVPVRVSTSSSAEMTAPIIERTASFERREVKSLMTASASSTEV